MRVPVAFNFQNFESTLASWPIVLPLQTKVFSRYQKIGTTEVYSEYLLFWISSLESTNLS